MSRRALALVALGALVAAPAGAEPGSPVTALIYSVVYQCPNETPQTFQYTGARRVPAAGEVKLETGWYWGRTRADRGQGCRILSVDDVPFRE
jgi:hypothetical protein